MSSSATEVCAATLGFGAARKACPYTTSKSSRRRPSAPRSCCNSSHSRRRQRGVRRPAARCGSALPAERSQLIQQRVGIGPGQRQLLLVHHRIGKASLHQHVAQVVHVDERRMRRRPAQASVELAQPLQRARAERRKHQEAVHCQHALPGAQRGLRIRAQVQHHVRPQQPGAAGRHLLRIAPGVRRGAQARQPAALRRGSARALAHRVQWLDMQDARAWIGLPQQGSARAIETPPVDQLGGLQPDQAEALGHAPRHFAVQPGRLGAPAHAAHDRIQRLGVQRARWAGRRIIGHAGSILSGCMPRRQAEAPAGTRRGAGPASAPCAGTGARSASAALASSGWRRHARAAHAADCARPRR